MRRRTYPLNVNNGFEDWGGYMAAKKQKLEEQFVLDVEKGSSEHKTAIFSGIAIFVNGYTVPPAEELKLLMLQHGGIYHHYQSPRTTHIIASNLPDTKIKQLKGNLKIVKPDWIVDSIKENKLLNYDSYLLYSNQSTTQPTLKFYNKSNQSKNQDPAVASKSVNGEVSHQELFEETNAPNNGKNTSNAFTVSDSSSYCELFEETNSLAEGKNLSSISDSDAVIIDKLKNEPSPSKQFTSKWTAKNASDDNFLTEFYQNSRLHHIATMGAMFKDYVNELREKNDKSFPGRLFLQQNAETSFEREEDHELSDPQSTKSNGKTIMHIDMDCFFVSVGLRNYPELRGLPVAVTHSKKNPSRLEPNENVKKEVDLYKKRTIEKYKKNGSDGNDDLIAKRISWATSLEEADSLSEIASCSYEARKLGVKNGMFLGQALKLCPNLKTIQYDFEGYKEVSSALYNCVASFTLDIEAVSCDEMFVDCTSLLKETGVTALQFATVLRKQIKDKTNCPCSTGFGSNRLLARLATRKAKPDGQFFLTDNIAAATMKTMTVSDLPGVGRANVYKLSTLGVKTCADLERIPLDRLRSEFGVKNGLSLYKNCRGEDDTALNFNHQRKSISAEVNYGIRFKDQAEADIFLQKLSKEVESRLREVKMKGRCITLKFMIRAKDAPKETAKFMGHGVCDHVTKSVSLPIPTADSNVIFKEIMNIAQQWLVAPQDLRGIGIQISRLEKEIKVSKSSLDCFLKRRDSSRKKIIASQPPTPPPPPVVVKNQLNEEEYPPEIVDFNNPQPGPSKSSSINKNSTKSNFNPLFNQKRDNKCQAPPIIDNTVLDALPDDIKNEVLKQYQDQIEIFQQIEKAQKSSPRKVEIDRPKTVTNDEFNLTLSQIDHSFLEALPNDLREELISDINSRKEKKRKEIPDDPSSSVNDVLSKQVEESEVQKEETGNDDAEDLDFSLSIDEIRTLIKEWISSKEGPTHCDISIFSKYVVHLVRNGELEHLSQILNMLHRLINRKDENSWRKAYGTMVETVQQAMMENYCSKLMVNEFFPP